MGIAYTSPESKDSALDFLLSLGHSTMFASLTVLLNFANNVLLALGQSPIQAPVKVPATGHHRFFDVQV